MSIHSIHSLALARAPVCEALTAADGARAERVDDGISFFDAEGHLLIRYEHGALHVSPPRGDLVLGSATGAVRIASASDVVIEAPRKVELRAAADQKLTLDARRVGIEAAEVVVRAETTKVAGRTAQISVERIATTAKEIVTTAERWETTAAKAVIRARDMVQEVTGALTEHLGRFRGVVREAYVLRTGRTDLRSKADTAIDGKRVLLG